MRKGRDRNKKGCDRNHGRDQAGRPVWCYALLLATAFTACRKEAPTYFHQPAIISPSEETIFAVGEAIGIAVETEAGVDYEVLEVYLDDALVSLKQQGNVDTLLSGLILEEGSHLIRAVCCDHNHRCLDEVVSFRVVSVPGASRQEESFTEMPVSGWHFAHWESSGSKGVDEHFGSVCGHYKEAF